METLLMLGDSLIEWGDWETLLPEYKVINRGFAGETVGGLAARLTDELDSAAAYERIIILSGTNDLLMGDQNFPVIFETMLPRLRMMVPEKDIIVVGLAPMQIVLREVETANSKLQEIVQRSDCQFLDLVEHFELQCRPIGNPCFLMDGVHFSPHGYRVFAYAVKDFLKTRP